MTTIATDGKTIAADGRIRNSWGVIVTDRAKKIVVRGNRIYAIAGPSALVEAVIKWHNDGCDVSALPVCDPELGWTLLVIDKEGMRQYLSNTPYASWLDEYPYALGSGADHAMGAMRAKATPEQAVKIAFCDSGSGGEIQVIDIAEALGLDKPLLEAAE